VVEKSLASGISRLASKTSDYYFSLSRGTLSLRYIDYFNRVLQVFFIAFIRIE